MSKADESDVYLESTEENDAYFILDDEIRTSQTSSDDLIIDKTSTRDVIILSNDGESCVNMSGRDKVKLCASFPDFPDADCQNVDTLFDKDFCTEEIVTVDHSIVSHLNENRDEATNENELNADKSCHCLEPLFRLVDHSESFNGDSETQEAPVYDEYCQVLEIPSVFEKSMETNIKPLHTDIEVGCLISKLDETSLEMLDNGSDEDCKCVYHWKEPECVSKLVCHDNENTECSIISCNQQESTLNEVVEFTKQQRPSGKDVGEIDANSCTDLKIVDVEQIKLCMQEADIPVERQDESTCTIPVLDHDEEDALECIQPMVDRAAHPVHQTENEIDEQTCTKKCFVEEHRETHTKTQHDGFYQAEEKNPNNTVKKPNKTCNFDSFNIVSVDEVKHLDCSKKQEVGMIKPSKLYNDATLITHDASTCFNVSQSAEEMARQKTCEVNLSNCKNVKEIPACIQVEDQSMALKYEHSAKYDDDTGNIRQNCFSIFPEKTTSNLLPASFPEPFVDDYDIPYSVRDGQIYPPPIHQIIQSERKCMGLSETSTTVNVQHSARTYNQPSARYSQSSAFVPCRSIPVSENMEQGTRDKVPMSKFCSPSKRETVRKKKKHSASLPTKTCQEENQSYYRPPNLEPSFIPSHRVKDIREQSFLQQEDYILRSQQREVMRDDAAFMQSKDHDVAYEQKYPPPIHQTIQSERKCIELNGTSTVVQRSTETHRQPTAPYSQSSSFAPCQRIYQNMQQVDRHQMWTSESCGTSKRETVHKKNKQTASLQTKSCQSYYEPPSSVPSGILSPGRELSFQNEDSMLRSLRGVVMKEATTDKQSTKVTASERGVHSSSGREVNCRHSGIPNIYSGNVTLLQQKASVQPGKLSVKSLHSQKYLMSVLKSWTVKDAILHVKQSLGLSKSSELDLFCDNRLLSESENLTQCCGEDCLYLVQRPSHRTVQQWQYFTDDEDMIDPYEDEQFRVRMSCGHAITPTNLFRYCWSKVKDGTIDITCPAVPNQNEPSYRCEKLWNFQEFITKACLSDDEKSLFQVLLFHNWVEKEGNVKKCPKCGIYIQSVCNKEGYFICRICGNQKYCNRCYSVWQNPNSRICSNTECRESLKVLQTQL